MSTILHPLDNLVQGLWVVPKMLLSQGISLLNLEISHVTYLKEDDCLVKHLDEDMVTQLNPNIIILLFQLSLSMVLRVLVQDFQLIFRCLIHLMYPNISLI